MAVRKTFVVWDMEGYSIPESLDPYSITRQIKSALWKEGFGGPVSILLYGPENTWSRELQDKLWEASFEVYQVKGVKSVRLNLMIAEVVSWAFTMELPSNLLILSQNKKNMEQFPKFSILREALENKGFYVASAEPETLINQETVFEEPVEFAS